MRILITGGTGLIGSEITRQAADRNWEVHYLSRQRSRLESDEHAKGFYWNPSTGEIDAACFKGVDAIINLAGATVAKRWTAAYKETILESRINSLRTLRHALKRLPNHQITRLVSASAIGIYPDSATNLYTEKSPVTDSFLGQVVQQWEREADTFTSYGIQVAKIRIGLVLSRDSGVLPPMIRSIRTFTAAHFGRGEQWQSWIHCQDVAALFLFAVERNLDGVLNAVAPNPVKQKTLLREVARFLKRPILLPGIPQFVMKAILGEMSTLLYESQRVSSKKIESHGFPFSYPNLNQALDTLLGHKQEGSTS